MRSPKLLFTQLLDRAVRLHRWLPRGDMRLGRNTKSDGDRLHLAITALYRTADGVTPFTITSRHGNTEHSWIGLVAYE